MLYWDVIENGNSFKSAAKTTTNVDGTSTTLIPSPVTTKENVQKKNDMKARSMLLMALPNEHLMTFNQYKNAKTLFVAIQIRFGDLNLKFLRSPPSEWNTHVVVQRNKPDLDTMSFDNLYNNFKIVEHEVKGTASLSSSSNSQNMAFVSSPSSTNKVNTAYKEMDLKWQLALLSMRTKRFFPKTGRKIIINASDTAGYDKSKVECFNCHKMGHFARECRGPRNQDSRNKNQDSSRRRAKDVVTLRPKAVNTTRSNSAVVNTVRANQVNAVKASAYFKEFDRGYVTFGGGAKGGKITAKGTLKTGTNSNDFVGTEESVGTCHSSKETGSSQDYILMPLWKDGSLFDSSSKNACNDEPQPSKFDMSDITTTYLVPSTPNTRIHKDHSLDHVIGDVQSGDELLQFKLHKVWTLINLPYGKRAIETKWVYRNKKDEKGELTFFLGLQVTQKDDGIFISQDKYVDEILKKFGFSTVKTTRTPMETSKPLLKDQKLKS
ncbi:ribonuclease H-like domain-containing protein [Tanacetum coccineum]